MREASGGVDLKEVSLGMGAKYPAAQVDDGLVNPKGRDGDNHFVPVNGQFLR